jgi:hypothetical protein
MEFVSAPAHPFEGTSSKLFERVPYAGRGTAFADTRRSRRSRDPPAGAAAAELHPVVAGAGFDGLVFHELRHTSAALAIGQSAHPLAIKERLGHSSITVTIDCCGGLFPRLEEAIGEGLDVRESLAGPVRDQCGTTAHQRRSAV